jgi:fatty acid amide hydrolase 2
MSSLFDKSALELAAMVKNKDVSPVELLEAHIGRIERVNPALNAVVAERFELAREEAREAERRVMAAREASELPPLLGVPCTMKDFYAVRGMPQTGGLVIRKGAIAETDAVVTRRVREAGAIVMGVTNVPEGGLWLESDNRVYGRTSNPWDLRRTAGGSSGGEGAIVASGGSPFGMGSDIGGSIRLPAAFCGVAGHKPTARMVPLEGHWPPLEDPLRSFLVCGPLARSVRDLMPLLRVIAGPEPDDAFIQRWDLGAPESVDFRDVTVFPVEESGPRVHPSLKAAVRAATGVLEARGARIAELSPGTLRDAIWIWAAMMGDGDETSYAELVSENPKFSILRELVKLAFRRSHHTAPVLAVIAGQSLLKLFPKGRSGRLIERGRQLQRELEELLGPRGILLVPPYTTPAPFHGEPLLRPFDGGYTAVFNVLEFPATQVPTGLDARGLPTGVQVVARRGNDHLTIAAALAIEEELGRLGAVDPRRTAIPGRGRRAPAEGASPIESRV